LDRPQIIQAISGSSTGPEQTATRLLGKSIEGDVSTTSLGRRNDFPMLSFLSDLFRTSQKLGKILISQHFDI
jgi:hypothetical protein